MGAEASLTPLARPVNPGEETEVELTVTNTGGVVDQFTFELLGDPAAWAVAEPSGLSLFPGQSQTAKLRFRPPVDPRLAPGPCPYAVRVSSNEDPQSPRVEEGVLEIAGIAVLSADLSPRTARARGKRAGKYQVALDNRGNAPVLVDLTGYDAQDLVDVTVQPPRIEVGPGHAAFVTARARARNRFWRGPGVLHRFTVAAVPVQGGPGSSQGAAPNAGLPQSEPAGQPGQPGQSRPQRPGPAGPAPLDASLLHEAAIPAWVGKATALLLLAAIALTALWFTVLKPVVRDAATGAANQALTAAGLAPGAGSLGGAAGSGGGSSPSGASSGPASGGTSASSSSPPASAPNSPTGPASPAPVAFAVDLKANSALTAGTHQAYTVTDLVLQNPNGDTGALTITRGGSTLISTRLENFRDYDLHFVTAITVGSGQSLNVSVTCDKPGQGQTVCTPAVLVSGMSHTLA